MRVKNLAVRTASFAIAVALACSAFAAREAKVAKGEGAEGEFEARRLFDKAQELIANQEGERGVKMLESILEQYPQSKVRYEAALALGKYYLNAHEQVKAIGYFSQVRALEEKAEELSPSDRELMLEAMYLTGVAHFQVRQYGAAFPILRKITTQYPNSVWANQSYYYIGMCHFAQGNWNKTIEALNLVGTFVDPDSPTVQLVEAGRRFYVKVSDADLPVLVNLGKQVVVNVETKKGDRERIECIPLASDADVFIGSLPTEVGVPKPENGVIEVIGGDSITCRYVDENAKDGQSNVTRESVVKVVSTAALSFTLGDGETPAGAAFLDQPLFIQLADADLDVSDGADGAEVKIISRYKLAEEAQDAETGAKGFDIQKFLAEGEAKYQIRDQVVVKLTEAGQAPVHSGRFRGKVMVNAARPDEPVQQSDDALSAAIDDQIIAYYTDERHINGETPRSVEAAITVIGEIDNAPKASQDVVFDVVVKCKKNLVEGQAYLELARIFRSMGLLKGAKEKAQEGLERADYIIRARTPIPTSLKQEAFRLKWELHMAADDLASAIATCNLFNRLYPDSPFVDQALMGIAAIRLENKQYNDALQVYRQVLSLPKSSAKAEAQFRIAEITELTTKPGSEAAIREYKLCAERYPESEFAGASLAKLVDYHIETKDFAQANTLLEQIFQDYPDAKFLDSMLLKWVLVAYRSGDYQKAAEKCSQLVFEYPDSSYAEKAKQIMPKIEAQLKKAGGKEKEG